MLGVPDAYELPPMPGWGYLKPDQSTLLRFKAAYVSGPPSRHRPRPRDEPGVLPGDPAVDDHRGAAAGRAGADAGAGVPAASGTSGEQESLLDVAVGRMEGRGPQAHQVWLPPLDVPDTLDELMPDLARRPRARAGVAASGAPLGGLTVPLGTVDRPREQRRDTLTVDLSGAGGHVAVVGGPRTGKSTLLRTLVASLALTTTPLESQFFVLDFGGGTFAALQSLPHVAGVGTRSEPDVVRRIVAEVTGIVDRREAYFRAHGIDSIETYRSRRVLGRADDGYGDVFLVVDGWSTLRADFDDLELELQQLASRGLTFGFHLVTASSRWADYRAAVRDLLGTRLELRLGDPMDSEVDRRLAGLVPPARPGRGLLPGSCTSSPALPRIDGDPDVATLGDGVEADGRAGPRGLDRPGRAEAAAAARAARRRRPAGPGRRADPGRLASAARPRREGAGAGRARPGRRAALAGLRRRAVGQERGAAQLRPRGDAHADRRSRPRSSSSTTGGRCSARCPTSTSSTT